MRRRSPDTRRSRDRHALLHPCNVWNRQTGDCRRMNAPLLGRRFAAWHAATMLRTVLMWMFPLVAIGISLVTNSRRVAVLHASAVLGVSVLIVLSWGPMQRALGGVVASAFQRHTGEFEQCSAVCSAAYGEVFDAAWKAVLLSMGTAEKMGWYLLFCAIGLGILAIRTPGRRMNGRRPRDGSAGSEPEKT